MFVPTMYQVLEVVRSCVRLAKKTQDDGLEEASIMFWCRSGRHRSVVMVLLARAVLESLNYEVTDSSS